MPALRRVGHKGADLIAPGNTFGSFDAAVAAGVDMIEFDVVPEPPPNWRAVSVRAAERRVYDDMPLLLAHDWGDATRRSTHTLEEGLEHLASSRFDGIDLLVDLKLPGYELRVVRALEAAGLVDRSLISTQYVESLGVIRASGSRVRLGWTVPKLQRDPFRSPFLLPYAYAGLAALRATLPARAARAIRAGRCDAMTAHWRLVTPRLVAAVLGAGGELYAWTVDELPAIRTLAGYGVTGVITNDPRLFAALA
jgi:glycerophosphoryl diester phosphodiesterase